MRMIHHHHHDIKIWKDILGRVNNWTYLTSELWTHTAYVTEVKLFMFQYQLDVLTNLFLVLQYQQLAGDPRFSAEYEYNSKYDGHIARNSSKNNLKVAFYHFINFLTSPSASNTNQK